MLRNCLCNFLAVTAVQKISHCTIDENRYCKLNCVHLLPSNPLKPEIEKWSLIPPSGGGRRKFLIPSEGTCLIPTEGTSCLTQSSRSIPLCDSMMSDLQKLLKAYHEIEIEIQILQEMLQRDRLENEKFRDTVKAAQLEYLRRLELEETLNNNKIFIP
jgi:hypothetical protein